MRLSVDINDTGFHKDAVNAMILVDLEPLDNVITVDTDMEYAIVLDIVDGILQSVTDPITGEMASKTMRLDLRGKRINIYREHDAIPSECMGACGINYGRKEPCYHCPRKNEFLQMKRKTP